MKKTVISALIVFWIVVVGVIISFMVFASRGSLPSISARGWFDMDYNSSSSLISEKSFSADEFKNLTVNAAAYDIIVRVSDNKSIDIKQYGPENAGNDELMKTDLSGGLLNISTDEFRFPGSFFNFSWGGWTNRRLEIDLPLSAEGGIVLKTASGDISISGEAFNPSTLLIESASGDVKTGALTKTGDFVIKTASGDINIDGDVISDNIRLESISGYIKSSFQVAVQSANFGTTSGKISLDFLSSDEFNISSISGNVSAENISGKGKVSSTSGNITFSSFEMTGDTDAGSVSGNIRVGFVSSQQFLFEGSSTSGDIRSSYPISISGMVPKRGELSVGENPSSKLRAHTTSGNINLS